MRACVKQGDLAFPSAVGTARHNGPHSLAKAPSWIFIMLLKYSRIPHFQSHLLFQIELNQEGFCASFHLYMMINSLSYVQHIHNH